MKKLLVRHEKIKAAAAADHIWSALETRVDL